MGQGRRDTGVTGVLVVDKPAGMTSHDVVQVVRRAAGTRKVGHTGTLDPDATGVLVCCLGRATRLVRFLQEGAKVYAAEMLLGRATTTQDASGETVAEHDASAVTEQELCTALMRFVGDIEQIPPMVSAIKIDGERLHEKARRGEEIERQPRRVTVHDLVLEDFTPGTQARASFLVTCSAGTYVRTIAHDVGNELGVGASLLSLRRLANGPFTVDEALPLERIEALGEQGTLGDALLPMVDAVRSLTLVPIEDRAQVLALTHGKQLPDPPGGQQWLAAVTGETLIGIYSGDGRPEAVLLRPEDVPAATG